MKSNLSTRKIGFDAKRLFHNFTGLGNYSRTLLKNLHQVAPQYEYHLYTTKATPTPRTQLFFEQPAYKIHFPSTLSSKYWRTIALKKDLQQHQIQLFHGLSHEIPLNIQNTNIKTIVTIHDLIFKRYPQFFSRFDRKVYDWKFKNACENSDAIVAISQQTKADIVHFYGIKSNKIQVIYQTCHEIFQESPTNLNALKKYNLPSDFLLYVGTIEPRKNLLACVKAIEILAPASRIPLVVVGRGKKYLKQVQKYIASHNLEKWVFFLQDVDLATLAQLFKKAKIFLYLSHFEGFGIPIIESLFSKTPVITSPVSALPEAAGKGAMYVMPENDAEIAHSIQRLLTDSCLYQELVQKGAQHVQQFRTNEVTKKMVDLYERNLLNC